MRNIVILNSLHFSYPLPILMRVSYNTLIVKQNTSDYYKYNHNNLITVYGPTIICLCVAYPLLCKDRQRLTTSLALSYEQVKEKYYFCEDYWKQ